MLLARRLLAVWHNFAVWPSDTYAWAHALAFCMSIGFACVTPANIIATKVNKFLIVNMI